MGTICAFDTSFLLLLLDSEAAAPSDPETGQPVEHARQRIEHLIDEISQKESKIIIPTPVLAETLARTPAGAGPNYYDIIKKNKSMEIAPFDVLAAIELAELHNGVWKTKASRQTAERQKVKVDRQILAVCKVQRADICYSEDKDMKKLAEKIDIETKGISDLSLPPTEAQPSFI